MRLMRQFQACLFFFLTKRFCTHKNTSHLGSLCAREKLLPLLFSVSLFFVLLVDFCLWLVFVRAKSFLQKKNKQAWNCPVHLIILYYLLLHYTILLGSSKSICKPIFFKGVFSYLKCLFLFFTCYMPVWRFF